MKHTYDFLGRETEGEEDLEEFVVACEVVVHRTWVG